METQTNDWQAVVKNIIERGNIAEVKREQNKIVVIEITRKVKIKTAITGSQETTNRGYEYCS